MSLLHINNINVCVCACSTDEAESLGVFGSPSFVVRDTTTTSNGSGGGSAEQSQSSRAEVFWGDDRLEEALDWACNRHRAKLSLAAREDCANLGL